MAFVSHLVFLLLSVQCSLQYWPKTGGHATNLFGQESSTTTANSWKNSVDDKKAHWFPNQVNNQDFEVLNEPGQQNPSVSSERKQRRINYRWTNINMNEYSQPGGKPWFEPNTLNGGNRLASGWYKSDPTSQQINIKPTTQSWDNIHSSGNTLSSPSAEGKPVFEDNSFYNTPSVLHNPPKMVHWIDIPVELNRHLQILHGGDKYINAKPETVQAEINPMLLAPLTVNSLYVPKINGETSSPSQTNKNVWRPMPNKATGQSGWYTEAILGSGGDMESKFNFQHSSRANTWSPMGTSGNRPFSNTEQNVWTFLTPGQIETPEMQMKEQSNAWNQLVSGPQSSVWCNKVAGQSQWEQTAGQEIQDNSKAIVSGQTPGWYRYTGAIAMKKLPGLDYRKPNFEVNPNTNRWNDGTWAESAMYPPSPYLTVPEVPQSYEKAAAPWKSETLSV